MTAKQLKVYKLFEKTYGEDDAKVIVTYFDEKTEAMKMEFATKKDLSDMKSQLELQMSTMELRLIGRLDTHFKWLVGLIISVAGLSIAISKML